MMKLFSKLLSKKSSLQNTFDGPYVFYKKNSIEAFTIHNNSVAKITDIKAPIHVRFSNHEGWDFSFLLKKELLTEPCIWENQEKIFVLSDIEGEFEAFRKLLLNNKIIDEQYNWIFGEGHLVINGDMFDRGNEVTSLLWLIYKLEDEAKLHGGYVHKIIGNHEVMNLSGDLRYVDEKYFRYANELNIDYLQMFDEHTELGRWLRTKNVMEKIGDLLFVHGGISPLINELKLSIEELNNKCRPYYDKADNKESETLQPLYNRQAVYWYRGYFREPFCSIKHIENSLQLYNCKQIIVGHTIMSDNPALYHEGKILNIDVDQHAGIHKAVLIEGSDYFIVDDNGDKSALK